MAKTNLPIRTGVFVEGVSEEPDGTWKLETTAGPVRAANVMLAVGRRGTPRQLGVAGEEQPKVHYHLLEPEAFQGDHALVVGGGNSAIETAISLLCGQLRLGNHQLPAQRVRALPGRGSSTH